jgi:deazaflavin-dependent oxidoreductase (nitroreductase family)
MSSPAASFNDQVISEFRETGGTVTRFGRALVLIHHIGAKSGVPRIAPARALRVGPDAWLVAASKAGAPENPAWYYNLLAHPDVDIEVPDEGVVPVHVTELTGEDRASGWTAFTDAAPGFLDYEKKTTRTIPLLTLTRRG